MKHAVLLALLCLYFSFKLAAQAPTAANGTVKGIVQDSATLSAQPYVTVLLREQGKEQPLKSTFSGDNGAFEFTGLAFGKYEILLTSVGFKNKLVPLAELTEAHQKIDLGKLFISSSANQLKEVQVTAEKLLIVQDIDKLTYNVEADPENQTMTALDMLRKVPLLTVDAEDNIQLNGSSSYRVLVNGKNSSLFVRNPKDVFKSMPANSIKSIEVITNPPAKYEAEGVGGIINIITHKKSINGYNGSLNGSLGSPQNANAGGYLTAKHNKFGLSAYYGNNYYSNPTNRSYMLRREASLAELEQIGTTQNEGTFQYLSTELSYEPDTLNLLTASFSTNMSNGSNFSFLDVDWRSSLGQLEQAYSRNINSQYNWSGSDLGLDYQHTFKRHKEQLLTLSYKLNTSRDGNLADIDNQALQNYTSSFSTTENDGKAREQTMQADYVHPIKKQTVELGIKAILRDNSSDYYYRIRQESGFFEEVPALSNSFEYSQDIYAAYTSVSLRKDSWGLKLGARLEQTKVAANFETSGTFAEQDYFNLIPNVTLSRKLKGMASVKLSYTQRIQRPSLWYINPYINVIDSTNISFGNPYLLPATSNVFTLAYNTFVKGSSINASLSHTFTNSSIQQYTTLGDDRITRTTFGNIGQNSTTGLYLSGNSTFFKKLSMNLNGTLNYVQLESMLAGNLIRNSGLTANFYSNASYMFEKNWRLSGNFGLNSPRVMLQGRSGGYAYHSFSLSKQFLKDNKATITGSISSPFQKNRRWFSEINDPAFYQMSESYFYMRRFNISFNYRFGKLKGDIARKKRGISNDDQSGGGEQKSGGN
ncbi:TonB-dependent receptor [Pontibacter qinzhouensis]|uniref:TonB-dependent receptor n=1 Tax=Pontibacter qinzhouensis TaxID=2603253 RepID=A0A5C8KAC9_9BACT|nr:TonB-dependent receptor [Pontibacter qinzhouensis]TXK48641.1 TonB-dependent receptor [Pontibacter qinzhouensis]